MKSLRFQIFNHIINRKSIKVDIISNKISTFFAENVFHNDVIKKYTSHDTFKSLQYYINNNKTMSHEIAEKIAFAMKSWAIDNGATHYTHWFQPLTGNTSEKHDTFFEKIGDSNGIEKFNVTELIQQEPDASSLPSGGLRTNFEAKGYTAWDPTSPAFIIKNSLSNTAILCIPTIFLSYTGESLDYKTPLIKSVISLEENALKICHLFNNKIKKVYSTLGIEQEYFLIDIAFYYARPDIYLTGRTLFGHQSAKNQQLEDHYFGSISERVKNFMIDLEIESFKLGIPLKTRHNEVAPGQFECAPIYEPVNIAIDHNQLLMNLIDKIGLKHNFKALLHEKPFHDINGSGKHNNWSIITDDNINLLIPGKDIKSNLMFLSFFVSIIKAVHDYSDLLLASIASLGNSYRLGGNEAPPNIISIFIGNQLQELLNSIENGDAIQYDKNIKNNININLPIIPNISFDNTDRNRTSPFAFTGNKFEFRAIGSSENCARPITTLSSIISYQFKKFYEEVNETIILGEKKEIAIIKIIRQYIKKSKNIIFNGNNYSNEWYVESQKRRLPCVKYTTEMLKYYISKKSEKLFNDMNILSSRELTARYDIFLKLFIKKVQIESRILNDLSQNHIIPAAIDYQNKLIDNILGIKKLNLENKYYNNQIYLVKKISTYVNNIQKYIIDMTNERKIANKINSTTKMAHYYDINILKYFSIIRYNIDKLETIIDDQLWPVPKYRELLFLR